MSSSSFQPPPIELHTPIAPTSPFVPPSHIPSSSSSVPHIGIHTSSANITASPSPHTIPFLASIGGPSPTVGEHDEDDTKEEVEEQVEDDEDDND
ncbi:hypothetical protein DEO72_LG6g905 [Vigna unguiculata]|uniref:Uncharacterized protein n=1 Tax=Vigna unguiculata TaxID=3917 RepID=A0A4D6M631_VIGUN|nr:hypothetical protein DEO72_LG6g905 [Vigna unguiculata]